MGHLARMQTLLYPTISSFVSHKVPKDSQDPFTSQFLIVELPGAEKLAEDPTELRMREGPTLNRSICAFGNLVAKLAASPKSTRVINYGWVDTILYLVVSTIFGTDPGHRELENCGSWFDK